MQLGRWALLLMIGGTAVGQTAAPKKPLAFEVVSIKRNKLGGGCTSMQEAVTKDGYHVRNCSLMVPIYTVYRPPSMGDDGFYGNVLAPDWLGNEKYDIDAKVADADLEAWQNPVTQREMLRGMLQTMLAERCKLETHNVNKEAAVYALVVGKDGPKLKVAESVDAREILRKHPDGGGIPGGQGSAVLVSDMAHGRFYLYGSSTKTLALLLSHFAGERPVVDKTGLTGYYDIELHMALRSGADDDSVDKGPSVFSAVQEQLGLKLEPTKGEIEMLAIDHVERPTEN